MKKYLFIFVTVCLISSITGCSSKPSYSSNSKKPESLIVNTETEVSEFQEETTAYSEFVPDNAVELLQDALDHSMIPEEELTPSGKLTNAINNATYISVLEDQGNRCKLKITYPNVKDVFSEMLNALPEDADQSAIDGLYADLAAKVSSGDVEMMEVTVDMDILTDAEGRKYLDWTPEAMRATTGGLYDLYYEMMTDSQE